VSDRDKPRAFPPKPVTPSPSRQGVRLNTSFNLLKSSFSRADFSVDPAGFPPERTLVLETVGSIDKFYKAAAKVDGLEFVQELIGEDLAPDEDFFFKQKDGEGVSGKILHGFVYLTMANQEALNKLYRYWQHYTERKNYKFPRGLAPLRDLFSCLHSVRYWDTRDRLHNTGLIEDWRERAEAQQGELPVEIDLWFRGSREHRGAAEHRVRTLIGSIGGQVVQTCTIESIQYHAVLASVPTRAVGSLLEGNLDEIEVLRCDDVMYFRPSGQCMAPIFTSDEEFQTEAGLEGNEEQPTDDPVIALLDGLPLENHEWIKDRVTIDDPDDWASNYHSPSEQVHGTSMASLIVRGDMENSDGLIPRRVYCRPIMAPYASGFDATREKIPDNVLPVDIVHRAVVRMFEPAHDAQAACPTIKIINLSIADPIRLFDGQMSPWAKLVDWLSEKYQVIFVISAGNHLRDIQLNMTNEEFMKLDASQREEAILKGVTAEMYLRRLMSPAESINAITVASSHFDQLVEDEFYSQVNPYTNRFLPSPINPITWGNKRSVKPEVLMPGGRATFRLNSVLDKDQAVLRLLAYNRPPGQKVASPGNSGALNAYAHTFGTSNAAALASRRLGFLYDTLHDLYLSNHGDKLSPEYEAVLLKALFCHGATQASVYDRIEELFRTEDNTHRFKSIATKYFGYGNVQEDRIHGCFDNQATILQCGLIKQDDAHTYRFRLPDSLNAQAVIRRLIITLAWFSPINPSSTKYRLAHLHFEPPASGGADNHLATEEREVDWQMVRKGTVQHEILTGEKAAVYVSGTYMDIAVNCRGEQGTKDISIPYGLVVTLDTPGVELPIYEEVKADIEAQHAVATSLAQNV
jgi:hypothetical protein